jgi:uncharacterized protein (TIGR00255 family)
MIHSMTGFGKATVAVGGRKFVAEIRSLNSAKGMDLSLRLPSFLREKELELRKILTDSLIRGKVDAAIYIEGVDEENGSAINQQLAKQYLEEIRKTEYALNIQSQDYLSLIFRMPDIFRQERVAIADEDWEAVQGLMAEACLQLQEFRLQEGTVLGDDMRTRVRSIANLLEQVGPYIPERMARVRERMARNLEESGREVDANRFEQEMIYYLEKLDITEEQTRLANHCQYFIATMEDPEPGRKLGFIAQEIGREINTIGSKANHAEIQRLVVMMKDELEKIKEQILNVL